MNADLVLKGGKVVTSESISECSIVITEGKIVSLTNEANLPKANRTIDLKGNVVLPGAIDVHTHWGVTNWRNLDVFASETRTESASAAAGGTTTVMHSLWNYESYKGLIPKKNKIIRENSLIDVVFYAVLMNVTHVRELQSYFQHGITSFKHFMVNDFFPAPDDTLLYLSMKKIQELGGTAMAHCETCGPIYAKLFEALDQENRTDLAPWNDLSVLHKSDEVKKILSKTQKRRDLAGWTDFRPDILEQEGMRRLKFFAELTGARAYSVHTTIKEGLGIAGEARQEGTRYYVETCPQYLTFTKDDKRIGVKGKVNPPLRSSHDVEALWNGMKEGLVQCIGTDHVSPTSSESKQGDIWTAACGFPGCETMLPVLISEGVNKRGISLQTVARISAFNNAKAHRIPNKGAIAVGYDADLVVVDLKKKYKVNPDTLHSASDVTLYDGWIFTGWPVMTIARGNIVMQDHQIVGKPGSAQVVKTYAKR